MTTPSERPFCESYVNFFDELRAQERALRTRGVRLVTSAEVEPGNTVAIEASYVFVIQPDDETHFRCGVFAPNGGDWFVPCTRYGTARGAILDGEIGAAGVARIVVDPSHSGPPKLYGAGERVFKAYGHSSVKRGDHVAKVGGDYTFIGIVVAEFNKLSGARRFVVENADGVLHIYSAKNLEHQA